MADLATIDAAITALETALATGEQRVTYNGKTVEFRSTQEITSALSYWQSQREASTSTPTRSRSALAYVGRGL